MGPGCWWWIGAKDLRSQWQYGRFGLGGDTIFAHRAAWLLFCGEIPEGLLVCHHCDNPSYVRPSHLFLGTHGSNMADKMLKGRHRLSGGRVPFSWAELEVTLDAPLYEVMKSAVGVYGAATALASDWGISMQVYYKKARELGVPLNEVRSNQFRARVLRYHDERRRAA